MTNPAEGTWPLVEVSAYMPKDRYRHVRIALDDGATVWVPCASQEDLLEAVREYRPGTDPDDPRQVHWVDHPGQWSGM